MAKFITAAPPQISAANRTRIQNWLFSKRKTEAADPSEITAEDMEADIKNYLKKNIYEFERQKNIKDFETEFPDLDFG